MPDPWSPTAAPDQEKLDEPAPNGPDHETTVGQATADEATTPPSAAVDSAPVTEQAPSGTAADDPAPAETGEDGWPARAVDEPATAAATPVRTGPPADATPTPPGKDRGADEPGVLDGDDGTDPTVDEPELDDDGGGDEATGRRGGLLNKQIQVDAKSILVVVAVIGFAVGAFLLGQRQARDGGTPSAGGTTATTAFKVPRDFVTFEDKDTGIKLAIPKEWPQFTTKDLDASYRLLIGVPDAKDTLRVRVNAYSKEITAANVADQKAVVDAIFSSEKITILADEIITLNGMPALFYVYKFTDSSGEPGIHAHFFVFQGRKMVTMVFEAVPEARYAILAPVFDQIKDSLVVAPGPPPAFLEELGAPTTASPGPTTVPGATTVPATTPASAVPPTSTP